VFRLQSNGYVKVLGKDIRVQKGLEGCNYLCLGVNEQILSREFEKWKLHNQELERAGDRARKLSEPCLKTISESAGDASEDRVGSIINKFDRLDFLLEQHPPPNTPERTRFADELQDTWYVGIGTEVSAAE
jgi:hypothetical protein